MGDVCEVFDWVVLALTTELPPYLQASSHGYDGGVVGVVLGQENLSAAR